MVNTTKYLIRLALLAVVIAAIANVTYSKFDRLKTKKSNAVMITVAERERQLDCLSKNIYYEAGGESFEGKVAVAQVTMNRVESGRYPSDVCKVVFQKNVVYERVVCQFSWYCEKGPMLKAPNNTQYTESMEVAKKVLLENFRLPSLKGAMYYHADYVRPNWNLPKITKIGAHIFYGERI